MLRFETKTELPPLAVSDKIRHFFGKKNLGLHSLKDDRQCLQFEGGGGFVEAKIESEEGETKVHVVARDGDDHVLQFAKSIKK